MAEAQRAGARYMPDRVSLAGIGVGAALIAAAIVVSVLGALAVVHLGNPGRLAPDAAARPGKPPRLAAPVELQTLPAEDIATFRAKKRELLSSYGWVDREHGIARVPIERAMALLAQRGETPHAKP
jgi:hypothetical protein